MGDGGQLEAGFAARLERDPAAGAGKPDTCTEKPASGNLGMENDMDDPVSEEELFKYCRAKWIGEKTVSFPVIDSTNARARQLAEEGCPSGTLVIADRQDAGRGRSGKSWAGPPGSGIYMTLLLRPDIKPENAPMLTLVAALAVARAIDVCVGEARGETPARDAAPMQPESADAGVPARDAALARLQSAADRCRAPAQPQSTDDAPPERLQSADDADADAPARAMIKWPNDILLRGRKVCGILTERSAGRDGYVLIGIGINVHNEDFPDEISEIATSIYLATGARVRRAELVGRVWEEFEALYEKFCKTQDLSALRAPYEERLASKGRGVRVLDPADPFDGVAEGITERGELIVITPQGRRLVSSGEVSVRGIYGYS